MLDRQHTTEILSRLDWSDGLNRDAILHRLLDKNLAIPQELLSAIPPFDTFYSPRGVIESVPGVVWVIHAEREQRARGRVQLAEVTERTRTRQVD